MITLRIGTLALLTVLYWPGPNAIPGPEVSPSYELTLSGRITDAVSGQPLPQARISVRGERAGTVSDGQGAYVLTLPQGWLNREIRLEVELTGYERTTQTLVLSNRTNTVDFALSPKKSLLDKIFPTLAAPAMEAERMRRDATQVYAVAGVGRAYNVPFNTESYAHINENIFRSVASDPLSTFSVDVDRASYANVRRFINQGARPPIDAVRIEELVNYFPYSDPEPEGDHPLVIHTEVSQAPWQPLHRLVRIGLKARSVDMDEAPPSNLVFLMDVSGSMNSPDKLPLLKTAFRMVVGQLRPEDRVAIVVYAGAAGLVLPSTSGEEKGTILAAIEQLEAGGSTAGGQGIRLAYQVAAENHIRGGNNRVILATDGDFNIGASSDSEMIRLIEAKRGQGTFLTVLGFGTGNLKDSKMEQIADHGNGNFSYIDSALEARKVLVNEMGGTLLTVAKDVKIQVEFNPHKVAAYRLIGYENRLLANEDFNDDEKDAGEVGAGHSVTALYEIIPVGVNSPVSVGEVDPLRYQEVDTRPQGDGGDELLFVKLRYKQPDGDSSTLLDHPVMDQNTRPSTDFRFASAVAAWGMLLRDSEFCGDFTLSQVADLAKGSLGPDQEGYRKDFVRLVEAAQSMELLNQEAGAR